MVNTSRIAAIDSRRDGRIAGSGHTEKTFWPVPIQPFPTCRHGPRPSRESETGAERNLLARTGLDFDLLDDGCCGMAGSFGYEAPKYEVSMRIAEQILLPTVRKAAPGILILADGYSCREQIDQCTDRHAVTLLLEVLCDALQHQPRQAQRG